ncbi:energy transducer TonB [Roseateles sp. NT4]|uniref:energy transducer TonB n=1 Tax=Roseateles sp. NT4 TaxID=3453715 RepID=UPI003EEDC9AC
MKSSYVLDALSAAFFALAALPSVAQPVSNLKFPKPDAPPKLIDGTCGTATYPKAAEQAGHEGVVLLLLTISNQGVVTGAEVVRSSKSAILDTESRFIAAQCRFVPALKDGKAVYSQKTREFVWRLETVAPAASGASGGG